MKAVLQDRYGTADVLELGEIDRPEIGEGEVLVRVRAAGVDPGVWHLMAGLPYLIRLTGFGFAAPKARVRGRDVAGTVEAVGAGVDRFRRGDAVFGACEGAFAEYAAAREDRLVPKPSRLSFEEAAALPTSGATALQALGSSGGIGPGDAVLVIGAAGGVGIFAVQIAVARGADVTGVCSGGKAELVRSLGASDVVDYTREEITDRGVRYDRILDMAGNRPLSLLRRALAPDGTLVLVGGEEGGRWLGGVGRVLRAVSLSPFVGQTLQGLLASLEREHLEALRELVEAGDLTPVVGESYPLEEASEAVRRVGEGHARGKLVIRL